MMKRIYGLDTLRFFAFLSIFFYHSGLNFPLGYLGVDFFFVLSSFLLTLLALNEIEQTGSFSRKNFFLRRVLRIFPLYYLVLFLVLILLKFISIRFDIPVGFPSQEWKYWLFLCNFNHDDHIYALRFLWSIAVEEQFYLLFMIVGVVFRKHLVKVVLTLCLIYFSFMFLAHRFDWNTYSNTLAYFINFACGMTTAFLYKRGKLLPMVWNVSLLLGLVVILLTIPLPSVLFKLFTALLFSFIIVVFIPLADRLKNTNILLWSEFLGKYTYGLYVYSGFVFLFSYYYLESHIPNRFLYVLVQFTMIVLISIASFELYEKHFIKLKKYFREKK